MGFVDKPNKIPSFLRHKNSYQSQTIMDGWKIAIIVICLKLVLLTICVGYRYKARKKYEKQRLNEEAEVQRSNQQMINWIEVQNRHYSNDNRNQTEEFENVQEFQPPNSDRFDSEPPPNYWAVIHETNRDSRNY